MLESKRRTGRCNRAVSRVWRRPGQRERISASSAPAWGGDGARKNWRGCAGVGAGFLALVGLATVVQARAWAAATTAKTTQPSRTFIMH